MGKKRQLQGAVVEIDMPVDVPPVVEQKKKREISDVQRANLSKGMAALKAKREAKAKLVEQPEPVEAPAPAPIVQAPAPVPQPQPVRERKPRVAKNYLTSDDFNSFKSELFNTLKTSKQEAPAHVFTPSPQQQPQAPVTIVQPVKERVITGRELLDKLFFNF